MRKSFKNIISFLLLSIFLFPTIATVTHKHDHFICHAKDENHLHKPHGKCDICCFEFSVFSFKANKNYIEKPEYFVYYFNNYKSSNCSLNSEHTLLLRAPPFHQV